MIAVTVHRLYKRHRFLDRTRQPNQPNDTAANSSDRIVMLERAQFTTNAVIKNAIIKISFRERSYMCLHDARALL